MYWFQINRENATSTVEIEKSLPRLKFPTKPGAWTQQWLETLLILLVFVALASQPAPDVNESHYLTKAKHFWNPNWCPGDLFLSSSFSHWLFYFCFGWLTKFVSLTTFAWIGRIATWTAIAWAWQRLSWRLAPIPFVATISAIAFLLLNERFHLAGEWVVGGFEAKGIAYAFVLIAMGEMIIGKWNRVWPWLGVAAAFHVLVGGWAMLAAALAWCCCEKVSPKTTGAQFPGWLLGLALLSMGAIPPLLADQNATPEAAVAAQLIYVNQRISHHLTFAAFPTTHVARFVLLTLAWWATFHRVRLGPDSQSIPTHPFRGLFYFGVGSLLISLGGLMLSGLAESDESARVFAAGLLRFYWFRFSDFAIPATMALAIGWLVGHWLIIGKQKNRQLCAGIAVAAMLAAACLTAIENQNDPRPTADQRTLPSYPDNELRTQQTYQNWRSVCDWIKANTPADAVFITPADQQTFKWYAGRTEVVNWKDIPQDAEAIVEWSRRVTDLLEPQKRYQLGLLNYPDEFLAELASKYEADYLLLPQREIDNISTPTRFEQVYPSEGEKTTFVVLKF